MAVLASNTNREFVAGGGRGRWTRRRKLKHRGNTGGALLCEYYRRIQTAGRSNRISRRRLSVVGAAGRQGAIYIDAWIETAKDYLLLEFTGML